MRNRIRRRMQSVLAQVSLPTALGVVVVACGGGKVNEQQAGKKPLLEANGRESIHPDTKT